MNLAISIFAGIGMAVVLFLLIGFVLQYFRKAEEKRKMKEYPKSGVALIRQERNRQMVGESFTASHDDEYTEEQLALAAMCYVTPYKYRNIPKFWPWDINWWKPSKDRIRELEKAGALIAAEIDRLNRQKVNPTIKSE